MKAEARRHGGRRKRQAWWLWSTAMVLALAAIAWMVWSGWRAASAVEVGDTRSNRSPEALGPSLLNSPQPQAARSVSSTVNSTEERVDEATMLEALKNWIKRREGQEVEVVESRMVRDAWGDPVRLNVMVTSLPNGFSADTLRQRLKGLAEGEREVQEAMRVAYSSHDRETVDRLAAEFSAARSEFIATNQVSSYKLSLTRDEPPVLAFWPGLNFETVREDEARRLAARKLGETAGLHQLVAYTSIASLLCFTNQAGDAVHVDPVLMAEVAVPPSRPGVEPEVSIEDPEREARIARQWLEMLASVRAEPK